MTYRHGKKWVVILLKPGETRRPEKLRCEWCHRLLFMVNKEVLLVIKDNKGIHWSELPADITVVEYKCRGCDYYYKVYTPQNDKAAQQALEVMEGSSV